MHETEDNEIECVLWLSDEELIFYAWLGKCGSFELQLKWLSYGNWIEA